MDFRGMNLSCFNIHSTLKCSSNTVLLEHFNVILLLILLFICQPSYLIHFFFAKCIIITRIKRFTSCCNLNYINLFRQYSTWAQTQFWNGDVSFCCVWSSFKWTKLVNWWKAWSQTGKSLIVMNELSLGNTCIMIVI